MFSPNELFSQINRLKQGGKILVNNFLSLSAIYEISKKKESILRFNEKAIILSCKDNGVNRLYFYLASLSDASALMDLLEQVGERPLVVDCIGKQTQVDELSQALCGIGFSPYTKMSRWRSEKIQFPPESLLEDKIFQISRPQDADRIIKLLYGIFDPLPSHLPDKEKLLDLISDELVFQVLNEEEIVAVVCLERVGRNGIYIYQDAVSKSFQATGIGILLLQFALYQYRDCHIFTSWTDDSNMASNRMHKALGMSYDGLKDTILIYR